MAKQSDFITLLKSAARASATFQGKARAVAIYMAKDYTLEGDDLKQLGADHKTMMAEAKKLAKASKITTDRNTWLAIGNYLYAAMAPTQAVEFDKGKGSTKTTTFKPASECTTARQAAAAAKQIREVHNLSDGRVGNTGGAVITTAEHVSKVEAICDTDSATFKAVLKMIRARGYTVTKAKAKVRKVKAPAMVMPKDITALSRQAG